MTLALHHD